MRRMTLLQCTNTQSQLFLSSHTLYICRDYRSFILNICMQQISLKVLICPVAIFTMYMIMSFLCLESIVSQPLVAKIPWINKLRKKAKLPLVFESEDPYARTVAIGVRSTCMYACREHFLRT